MIKKIILLTFAFNCSVIYADSYPETVSKAFELTDSAAPSDGSPAPSPSDQLSEIDKRVGKSCLSDQQEEEDAGTQSYIGKDGLTKCETISNKKMKIVATNSIEWIKSIIATNCLKHCDNLKNHAKSVNNAIPFNNSIAQRLTKCVKENIGFARSCVSVAYLIKAAGKDWDNPEHVNPSSKTSSGSSAPVIITGQNGMSTIGNDKANCQSAGVETLDYLACKDFNDYADGLEVAHAAVDTGQKLYYQNKALDTSLDASKNAANDATAGLKAQKSSFKDAQEYHTQKSAIEASKAAILISRYQQMPDEDKLKKQCEGVSESFAYFNSEIKKYGFAEVGQDEQIKNCKSLLTTGTSRFAILMNQQERDKMKTKMVKLGVNAVAEGANAYMAGQRVNQLNDAIANVNNFKPTTSPGLEQAVEASFCQMNPTAAKCRNNLNSQFSTIGDNIVDFDGNGAGVVYNGDPNTDSSSGGNGTNSNSANSNGKKTSTIGSAITNANNGSGLAETGSAANISKGQGPAPTGGGGGGGAAGGGSGPGGLPNTNQAQAGTSSAVTGKAPSYHGGGFSMMGGLGIKSAKKTADSGNPLSGLFNKNKEGGDKVVNFRGPASTNVGNKSDNLFNMISNRYSSVNTDKRLLEYEEGPGK